MQKATIVVLLIAAALFPGFLAAIAIHEASAMARGIASMAAGLIILWVFVCGALMFRLRDAARRSPSSWCSASSARSARPSSCPVGRVLR